MLGEPRWQWTAIHDMPGDSENANTALTVVMVPLWFASHLLIAAPFRSVERDLES